MADWIPESRQGISHTRVGRGNIRQEQTINVYVTDGAVPGFGLWQWGKWAERVAGAQGPAARATRLALRDELVRRDGQDSAVAAVNSWLSDSSAGSMTIGVKGKHGTGLTSCLFSLAASLASSVGEEALFVADDVDRFFRTDLAKVLPGRDFLILVIDDADEQSAHRPVSLATGSMRVCTIYSTSNRSYAGVMATLNKRGVGFDIELPDVPTPSDIKSLQLLHRRPNLSLAESHAIRRGNFRSVTRILNGSPTTRAVTQRLGDLRKSGIGTVSTAAAYLLLSTARDTPIPQALLRRALGAEIPGEVMNWVQVRPYVGQRGRNGNLLWIEDRAAAKSAEDAWRIEAQLDITSFEESVQQTAQALLSAVSIHSAAERTCIRRICRQLPLAVQENLAKANVGLLRDVVDNEQRSELVFGWMPILQLAGIDVSAIIDARLTEDPNYLDDGATLILAIQALGSDEVVRKLATQVDASHMWSTHSWVKFIAMLEHVPDREASTLMQAAMPWLGAHNDLGDILGRSNTCQLILPLVTRSGSYSDRLHIRAKALPLINDQPHITSNVLHLTGRCIMQRRSGLALLVMRMAVTQHQVNDTQALTAFCEEFEELRSLEEHESLGRQTLESISNIFANSTWKPSVQNHPRTTLLSFAGTWDPEGTSNLIRESARFLEQSLAKVPVAHVAALFAQVMRMMAYRGGVSPHYLELALAPFAHSAKSHHMLGICAVHSLMAFASASTVYSKSAQHALRALVCDDSGRASESIETFLHQVSHLAARSVTLRVPGALLNLDQRGYVARSLIKGLRFMGDDQESILRSAVSKWRRTSYVEMNLAEELLRLGMQNHDPSLFRLAEDASASWRCLAVGASVADDLNGARQAMRKLSLEYEQKGEGAHPSAVTLAATAMSQATTGNESDLYRLVARLMNLGPLR